MNHLRVHAALLVLFLVFGSFAFAQVTNATVSGTVSDPSGAHIVVAEGDRIGKRQPTC